MRISDWSSDVCSSDLPQRSDRHRSNAHADLSASSTALERAPLAGKREAGAGDAPLHGLRNAILAAGNSSPPPPSWESAARSSRRSEEHTSELQSLMRISYAVFCLKKKNKKTHLPNNNIYMIM